MKAGIKGLGGERSKLVGMFGLEGAHQLLFPFKMLSFEVGYRLSFIQIIHIFRIGLERKTFLLKNFIGCHEFCWNMSKAREKFRNGLDRFLNVSRTQDRMETGRRMKGTFQQKEVIPQ